jgi:hypothetical protein
MMYSLEEVYRITGDNTYADLLERVTYNALPTQITDKGDARQYYQQINQVEVTRKPRNFSTPHQDTDILFGVLSGYPCCTCNLHQGWPKFVQNLWLKSNAGGVAAMVYAPSTLSTTINDVAVVIDEQTCYPFEEQIAFSFTFPDPENGIFTNSKAIRLKETDASKAFIDKLMCKGKLDNNGLANHNAEKYYSSDSAFVHNLPGLYIEVAEAPEGEGAVFALAGASTGIQIMGRTRNAGADADILADTLNIAYHFKSTKESKYGKVSAQGVKFDYSNAEFGDAGYQEQDAQREEVNVGYIEGCGGVFTELNFTDEFLYSLRELNNGDDTFVSAAINQAMLKIYIEGSEYDYNKIEPIAMADKLNSSLTRLGIYTDYKTLTPIPDYLYSQESSGVLYFNGYMNRSLACYEMNISSYIQSLVNEVLNMEENADGTLDFSKLVIPRKLYLGPEAYDGFSFKRSIIQGSDEKTNLASIQLELTYTLVK